MKRVHSITAIALTGLVGLSILGAPIAANASEEGKRNTTYALGAAAAALLLTQKNKLPGLLAAGGAVYAYSQYNKDVQARHRYEQGGYYDNSRNHWQHNGYDYRNNSDYRYNENSGSRYHRNNNQDYRDNQRNNHWNNRWSR